MTQQPSDSMAEIEKAVQVLKEHNKWRRGYQEAMPSNPKELGCAIDIIVDFHAALKATDTTERVGEEIK